MKGITMESLINDDRDTKNKNVYYNLFPKPVSITQIGREFTKKELNFIRKQETRLNTGNLTSVDNYILRHKEMLSINKLIEECVNNFYHTVFSPKEKVDIYITQSWLNYTEPGKFHHKHSHPNSFISGVLYINAIKEKDKIYFHNDSSYNRINVTPKEWNIWNSESWWLPIETGSCILFDSSFPHSVDFVESDDIRDTRISLSFNTFLKGYIGDEQSLTGLRI
jgi:uncharacterized protein (TIGR02466 family)